MDFDQMSSALRDVELTQRASDMHAERMARLLVGRLRHVNASELKDLKRELRGYNIHTGSWKK